MTKIVHKDIFGMLSMEGDIGGTCINPRVVKIQGVPISCTELKEGDVLEYNEDDAIWVHADTLSLLRTTADIFQNKFNADLCRIGTVKNIDLSTSSKLIRYTSPFSGVVDTGNLKLFIQPITGSGDITLEATIVDTSGFIIPSNIELTDISFHWIVINTENTVMPLLGESGQSIEDVV
jgi:hypothetical protein